MSEGKAAPQIWYFTPYSSEGLGVAYNDCCSIVPNDEDWICLMDTDIMFFSSQKLGQQIEDVLFIHPTVHVFTCMTNRMCARCVQQSRTPGIREERDLVKLKQEADRCARSYWGKVHPVPGFFAGYFMVFQKKLWKKYPFPRVGSAGGKFLGVDTAWSHTLRENRVKVGIMLGLMATHFFRLDKGEADLSHLNDKTHGLVQMTNPRPPPISQGVNVASRPPSGALRPAVPADVFPRAENQQAPGIGRPARVRLNPNLVPPGGFWFVDKDGVRHIAATFVNLVKGVVDYRKRTNRVIEDPEREILKQIYERAPRCCVVY